MANDFKYEITKQIKELSNKGGYTKEVNIIKYGDNEPLLDIRKWDRNNDKMQKGITLNHEEAEALKEALKDLDF